MFWSAPIQYSNTLITLFGGQGSPTLDKGPSGDPCYMALSAISRIGVFAARDLHRRERIGVYTGEIITSELVADARQAEYKRAYVGEYLFRHGRQKVWTDATFDRCPV